MKRVIASLAMAIGLLLPAVPAHADHDRGCRQIYIHFRPTYCQSSHNGWTWIWICPDYYGGCFEVSGPIDTRLLQ